jgi:hypothetical protein
MNAISRPEHPDAPHELDGLLRAFYRSEMPEPWPTMLAPLVTPAQSDPTSTSWWAQSRSRLALAASVALLMVACWWMTARTPIYTTPVMLPSGAGDAGTNERKEMIKILKEKEKRGQQPSH